MSNCCRHSVVATTAMVCGKQLPHGHITQAHKPTDKETATHAHTHANTPVNIYRALVCQQLSLPLITSIHPSSFPPLPPHPPVHMQSLPRCCGLPLTVIEGSWPEQCEEGGGKKERIGGERDEKRKGGGNHSSETHGCGMAYYRSNV